MNKEKKLKERLREYRKKQKRLGRGKPKHPTRQEGKRE